MPSPRRTVPGAARETSACQRGARRGDPGAGRRPPGPRRGRLRAVAALPAAPRRARARRSPLVLHRGRRPGRLAHARGRARGAPPRPARPSRPRGPARAGGEPRRRDRRRHAEGLAGHRRTRARRSPRARRRRGFRHSIDAHRRTACHRCRGEQRRRRAVRRLSTAPRTCRPAAAPSPRRHRGPARAAAACSTTGTTSTARVERGYAGRSLWDWHKLPDYLDPRYRDYARANASIGINGTVLTNVNANATSLTAGVPGQGRGAGRRVPALRHPRLPDGALQRADRDRRPEDGRSARPRRAPRGGRRRPTRSTAASPTSAASS